MKHILLLPFVLTLPAFAGPSPSQPAAPAPSLYTWFAGASVGYLTELEEPMYNLHVGTDTSWNLGGWNVALFGEIGYAGKDEDWSGSGYDFVSSTSNSDDFELIDGGSFDLGDLESLLSDISDFTPYDTSYDLDLMPITLNAKFERPISGNLNAYFGGGLGVARVDLDVNFGGGYDISDDDWVFTAQLFTGLNYNVNQNFEVYGGVRWIYYDDASFSGDHVSGDLEVGDDYLFELGARFNF
jgi:opacity protein-like surface antigen